MGENVNLVYTKLEDEFDVIDESYDKLFKFLFNRIVEYRNDEKWMDIFLRLELIIRGGLYNQYRESKRQLTLTFIKNDLNLVKSSLALNFLPKHKYLNI